MGVDVPSVVEDGSDELLKLMDTNRRLKNQVISLQGNVKEKKNKLKKLKRKGSNYQKV